MSVVKAKQPINPRGKLFPKTLLLRRHVSVRSLASAAAAARVERRPMLHSHVVAVDTVRALSWNF